MEALHDPGHLDLLAGLAVLLAVAVPVQVVLGPVVARGLLEDVDLGAVAAGVADRPTSGVHIQKADQNPGWACIRQRAS